MIFWMVIVLLLAGILLVIHPSQADYVWFQSLRRPRWISFHVWSPILQLLAYAGVLVSLVLVRGAPEARPWSLAFAHLLLIAINQLALCFTCQSHRLKAGSVVGLAVGSTGLALAIAVYGLLPLAALALVPFLLVVGLEAVAQWQLPALNGHQESGRSPWMLRPQYTPNPIGSGRRRGR